MRRVSRFHFEPGTVYLFTESRKDEPEYGLFGLFDCMDRGKIKLEAVQHRPCGLTTKNTFRTNIVTCAKRKETRSGTSAICTDTTAAG